jgi:hypothetical protein
MSRTLLILAAFVGVSTDLCSWVAAGKPLAEVRAGEPKTFLFDFGTPKSELRAGFTRVTRKTAYDAKQGYGWRTTAGLKEHYQTYTHEWKDNPSRGRAEPPPIYANEVTCDAVMGKEPNAFQVDMPAGRYRVWLLCGLSSGSPRDFHWFTIAAGTQRSEVKIPGPYIFEKRVFDVQLAGGPLAIEFQPKTDWMVAGMAVYPAAEESRVRGEVLDALEQEIYFLPPDVAAKWKETKHVDDRPLPEFTAADRKRGYALFARHWSEIIYPNTVPRASELNPELQIFASPGEYEPVTFTVCPLADLGASWVKASPLRCGPAVIPAANVDVRSVRYMLVRPNYSSFFQYHVAPDVLEHRPNVEIRQGCNQRFWITVHVPESAAAGVYEGQLTFQPAGGSPAQVKLAVRVLPIRLQKNPQHIYGAYYYDPLKSVDPKNTSEANAYFQRRAELERADMVAHGMNYHTCDFRGLKRESDGRWIADGEANAASIALDRKYGLAGFPLVMGFPATWYYTTLVDREGPGSHLRKIRADVPQSYFDEVTRMVEAIERERRARGWPEFLYYPIDEPSTQPAAVQFMVNILKAVKRAGVRTYVTADPDHEGFGPMWPYVDVWCCQPFVFDHEKISRLSREKKIEFWCYPNHASGENDHTPVRGARMSYGYGFWRSGFRALVPWIYSASVGDPWNYLDGSSMDFVNRSTADGEPVPVALWEAFREGIDDGRYIYTLEQLCAQAEARGLREAAAAGRRELQSVWDSIVVQEKYKYDGMPSGADFDARRWCLAAAILKLQEAVK